MSFRAKRIRPANGVVYLVECDCANVRQYGICDEMVEFFKASPKHWRFVLRWPGISIFESEPRETRS